jgi:NAD/NADP transhydrogenase beta subunit
VFDGRRLRRGAEPLSFRDNSQMQFGDAKQRVDDILGVL